MNKMKSLSTSERLIKMETRMDDICSSISEQKQDIKEIINKLDKLDKKFAGKWVEKSVISIAITTFSAIIFAIIKVIQ